MEIVSEISGMSDFMDWEEPLPFVIVDDGKKLQINQNTAALLSQIDQAAVVVGISGSYRSGKSYLMNRIAKKRKGFPVGHELQTETKGIWIWCLRHPLKSNTALILLDSEGLDSSHEDNRIQDPQIITLTVLLCSAFLYNVTGNIDSNAIDRLHLVTELVKRVQSTTSERWEKTDTNLAQFSMHLPLLILVIRNFRLARKINGRAVTPDEYFEEALADNDRAGASFNQPRRIIRKAFKNRRCFTLPIPFRSTENEDSDCLTNDKLSPKFINQCDKFCKFIHETAPVKEIDPGNIITGQTFLALCESYVVKLNSDHHICLEPATAYVIEKQNEEAKKGCLKIYRDRMNKNRYPISEKDLNDLHKLANDKAIAYLCEHIYFDEEEKIFEDTKNLILNEFVEFKERNDSLSLEKCAKILDDLYKVHLADKISTLYRSGGYQEYQRLMNKILEEYDKQTRKELKSGQAKQIFLNKQKSENDSIKRTDTALSKWKITLEKNRLNEEKTVRMEKRKNDYRRLQMRMEQTEDEFNKECKNIMEIRMLEMKRLFNEGHLEEAVEIEVHIKELQQIIKIHRDKIQKKRTITSGLIGASLVSGIGIGRILVHCGLGAATGTALAGIVAVGAARWCVSQYLGR